MIHDGEWGHHVLGKTQEACDISNMGAKTLRCCFRKHESLKNILEASASEL